MTTTEVQSSSAATLRSALVEATRRIPPLWPLRHFVAVNPFVGLSHLPFSAACTLLRHTTGAAPLLDASDFRALYHAGEITDEDLTAAGSDPAHAVAALAALPPEVASPTIETIADRLDRRLPHAHWAVFVTDEISKFCATYFDDNQTTWRSPWLGESLFAAWRESARHDRNPEAFGLRDFRATVAALPPDAESSIAACVARLAPAGCNLADFLHRHLVTIAGWAGYAQYLVREEALRGRTNSTLRDLLAIRLSYEVALLRAFGPALPPLDASLPLDSSRIPLLRLWQTAYEHRYQQRLARRLATNVPASRGLARPAVQAVFCIDVRSEVFRRHLEAAAPSINTVGFAGFFGFPVAHRTLLTDTPATHCPVLLVPPVESIDTASAETTASARAHEAGIGAWKAFQNSAASCFAFVDTFGLSFGAGLTRRPGSAAAPTCHRPIPALTGDDSSAQLDTLANLCAGALRNMSLTTGFARLLLICGHGSTSANNPYASALDCGACGGHAGDVNARLAANALNHPGVRTRLAARGLHLPADTWCVAGLHHTTSDDVTLFELDRVPASHAADVEMLRTALARAGDSARRERAPSLGLAASTPDTTTDIRARAADIAQIRPEWGLANNAAILVAPRMRSRGLDLAGRVFLHDYDHAADADSTVLDLILAAPVVVASWINLQYYASRVDPTRYGSGNKVLHNVAGGLGVFEGNGGDLRPGLPLQSLHDGEKFVHEPRRLSVFVEAPRAKISLVLARQAAPRELLDHEWIHLFALEGSRCFRYVPSGSWVPFG